MPEHLLKRDGRGRPVHAPVAEPLPVVILLAPDLLRPFHAIGVAQGNAKWEKSTPGVEFLWNTAESTGIHRLVFDFQLRPVLYM